MSDVFNTRLRAALAAALLQLIPLECDCLYLAYGK